MVFSISIISWCKRIVKVIRLRGTKVEGSTFKMTSRRLLYNYFLLNYNSSNVIESVSVVYSETSEQ